MANRGIDPRRARRTARRATLRRDHDRAMERRPSRFRRGEESRRRSHRRAAWFRSGRGPRAQPLPQLRDPMARDLAGPGRRDSPQLPAAVCCRHPVARRRAVHPLPRLRLVAGRASQVLSRLPCGERPARDPEPRGRRARCGARARGRRHHPLGAAARPLRPHDRARRIRAASPQLRPRWFVLPDTATTSSMGLRGPT